MKDPNATMVRLLPLLSLATLLGCGSPSPASAPAPSERELDSLARNALRTTMPDGPVQITFDFRLREADLRFRGRGVARVEPPYKVRIDLFTSQGESLFRAALVDSDVRIPPGVPTELAPPPALLWAALGVFRPDAELRLQGGRTEGPRAVTLRYEGDAGEDVRFRLRDGLLTRAEIRDGGHLIEEVDLELGGSSPQRVVETVYRNRALFVELTFSLESFEHVEGFPSYIWTPGGRR